jgi:hypothetical protein
MAAATFTFTGPNGSDPVQHILRLQTALDPTVGDGLWAGMFLRSRIRQRTAQGRDVQGQSFAPYTEKYAAAKARRLGHASTVDLFGAIQHPHMLNQLQVSCGGTYASGPMGPFDAARPAKIFEIGLWDDDAAARGRAHDEGAGHQPVRHWFGISDEDARLMENGLAERMTLRAQRVLGP